MPSDISQAVEQDQIAESLLGEPEAEATASTAGTEETVEQVEEQPTVEQEQAPEETADDWLPTEQEKVFPPEVLAKYAPRYGFSPEELEGDPRIANLVKDKLNADIYVNQLQQREELQGTEETAHQERQEPTQPQMNAQQWAQHVDRVAEQFIDPDMAMHYTAQFLKVFGVKDSPTPEMAKGFSHVLTSGVINVLNSVLPQMLNSPAQEGKTFFQSLVEQNFEGFHDSYESQTLERAWQKAVSSDPGFAKLPSFNTVGSSAQRVEAVERLGFTPEEFENLQLRGKDGKPLSAYQNTVKKFTVLAKQMAGQQLTPKEAQTFVEAGKKAARQQQIRRDAGNLGSGKSNGQIAGKTGSGPFQTNNDLFDEEAMSIYRSQHGSL